MENDGPVVGPDAPTAKSKAVKLDNRDRDGSRPIFQFGLIHPAELLVRKRNKTAPTAKDRLPPRLV